MFALGRWTRTIIASDLTPTHQAVAHALGMYADRDGGSVYPGVARLAADVGVSERTVSRALVAIRRAGLAIRVSRSRRRQGLADVHRLICAPAKPSSRSTDTAVPPSNRSTTGGGAYRDEVSEALDKIPALGRRERHSLTMRARRLLGSGTALDVVLAALRAPLPSDVASPASVLASRLLNVEGMTDGQALSWIKRRTRVFTPRAARRRPAAPRTAAAFGETSQVLASW